MSFAPDELRRLYDAVSSGDAMLLTGAGFSSDALARDGRPLPLGDELATSIWRLCFDGPQDASTLPDLFEHALTNCEDALHRVLDAALRIDTRSLDERHRAWFAMPWRRIYTLNVDDLGAAVAERFALPRPVREVSALTHEVLPLSEVLDVVKLNGCVRDGPRGVTFATTQYGQRLAQRSRWYAQLAADLARHPFVVVGSRLDEAPLWQHAHDLDPRRPTSWVVAPELTRARASLLESFGFVWLRGRAEDVRLDRLLRRDA